MSFALFAMILVALTFRTVRPTNSSSSCAVFCHGELLATLQNQFIFGNDSKTFVDSPLRNDPEEVLAAFYALPRPLTTATLTTFAQTHFDPVGSDLVPYTPTDWKEVSPLLAIPAIANNHTLRAFVVALNQLWLELGRKPTPSVRANPQRHTLLPTKHPLIVPGGRFRESYYWDSYWIVKGLLYSGMNTTAAGIVDNFVDFVEQFGFVPNGGRRYYLTRSQPPLLSEMVRLLWKQSPPQPRQSCNRAFATRIQALEREHEFFTTRRTVNQPNGSKNAIWQLGHNVPLTCNIHRAMALLNRYDANTTLPRPESFREDEALVRAANGTQSNASQLLRDIAAAAESGWDFSSRWFRDHKTLETVRTTQIIPVELTVIMARMERNICDLLAAAPASAWEGEEKEKGAKYTSHKDYCALAAQRWNVLETCMWNDTTSRWNDLVVDPSGVVSQMVGVTSVANYIPLWGASWFSTNSTRVVQAVQSLRDRSGLFLVAGLSTTTTPNTTQQWDYPNAWAPLQDWILDGIKNCVRVMSKTTMPRDQATELLDFANELSQRWLNTNVLAWQKSGYEYEKYDSTVMGKGGGGGEYVPQIGFGWSNGVMFELLNELHNDNE